jgi:glycosyltransferase involved in cell wall biosynthesis
VGKRILYVDAVSPHKGLHVLLDAFSIVLEEYPNVQLDVVGLQANYPLAENFDLGEQRLIESIYPFYAYDWTSKLKAKLALAPPDAGSLYRPSKAAIVATGERKRWLFAVSSRVQSWLISITVPMSSRLRRSGTKVSESRL